MSHDSETETLPNLVRGAQSQVSVPRRAIYGARVFLRPAKVRQKTACANHLHTEPQDSEYQSMIPNSSRNSTTRSPRRAPVML